MYSVTKLISLLDKPFIPKWANNLGLNGISLDKYMKEKSKQGDNKHEEVQNYLLNGIEFDGFEKVKYIKDTFEVVGCEVDINNGFIKGRVDLILKHLDDIYIVDFKSNDRIYLSTKLQLSAYSEIIGTNRIFYMNFTNYELIELNIDVDKYYEIIKRLYQIQKSLDNLNERL
jgi:hypothetical protein